MSDKFKIEIITPEKLVLSSDTTEVIIPSYEGEMGILYDHTPLITFLKPGIITIISNAEKKYFVEEGNVEFSDNNLLILTTTATELSGADKSYFNTLLEEAEKKMSDETITDKERYFLTHKITILKEINQ